MTLKDGQGRIVSIGSERFVNGFRILGIDGFIFSGGDLRRLLDLVLKDQTIAIVFMEEELYYKSEKTMEKIKMTVERPLFVEISIAPSSDEKPDIIANLIKKNIGISLD